jgi:hypothetical protein
MNHQPFENWLLSEETLPPEQASALQEHLRTCDSCRKLQGSWNGVAQMFCETPQVGPAAGFANRWQARLAEQRRITQRRQVLAVLAIFGTGAFVLFALLSMHALEILRSPGQLLMIWIYRLLLYVAYADAIRDFFTSFGSVFFGFLPAHAWLFVLGAISMAAVLWVVLYQHLTSPRRIQI